MISIICYEKSSVARKSLTSLKINWTLECPLVENFAYSLYELPDYKILQRRIR